MAVNVSDFFTFFVQVLSKYVGMLLDLPFMDDFGFGYAIVALVLFGVIIKALISSISVASFGRSEADRHDSGDPEA